MDTADPAISTTNALTFILQVANVQPDAEVHRQVGIDAASTFEELHRVLTVCFGLEGDQAPWHFFAGDRRINPAHRLEEFIAGAGDRLDFRWGLWDFWISVAGIYPRDRGTPHALCVGGSGAFPGTHFDVTAINAELTGQETIDEVLDLARPEIRRIIERTKLYDFVPLLQAMDLSRVTELPSRARNTLAALPLETTMDGQDAFWCTVLGMACLGGEELAGELAQTTMEALGWVEDDGSVLTEGAVRELCGASVARLDALGGSPLERLDMYRVLLRR